VDLQSLILSLSRFWSEQECVVQQPYDLEVGAGTMHPETFLRVLGPEPYRVAYVQPSRRPADARFGENPFRFGKHFQMQVILKPSPDDVQDLYLASLKALGVDVAVHDVRFEEDNWESPTLGAWGVGWQVLLDGVEITQFTYFQQAGGLDLRPISAELTYGLERIAMFLQRKNSGFEMSWGGGLTYGQVRHQDEVELSRYAFEIADVEMLRRHFGDWEGEAGRCLAVEEPLVIPGLEAALKMSHLFNLLDARGAIAVTERVALIGRVRKIAQRCAKAYVAQRERLGFPLGAGEWGQTPKGSEGAGNRGVSANGGNGPRNGGGSAQNGGGKSGGQHGNGTAHSGRAAHGGSARVEPSEAKRGEGRRKRKTRGARSGS
jgi:glycyl-tRNA synthetase alpha chain